MRVVPRFCYPAGTEVTLFSQRMVLNRLSEHGYEFTNLETGTMSVIPLLEFIEYHKLPGTKIDALLPLTGNRLKLRLGGYASSAGLGEEQREHARFHYCLCQAMAMLQNRIRTKTKNPGFRLSIRKMGEPGNRRFVRDVAQTLFGKKIHLTIPKGGRRTLWGLYQGRTMMKYFGLFEDLETGEDPLDALVPLDHLKGNADPRICTRSKELMTQAWEEIGLDIKAPSVANVYEAPGSSC